MNSCMFFALVLILGLFVLPKCQAELCNSNADDDFHFYCEGSSAFCCDYRFGIYWQCCYYFYGYWYFWFSLITGFFVIFALIALVCKCCKKPSSSQNANNCSRTSSHGVTTVTSNEALKMSGFGTEKSDAPPSYDTVYTGSQMYQPYYYQQSSTAPSEEQLANPSIVISSQAYSNPTLSNDFQSSESTPPK